MGHLLCLGRPVFDVLRSNVRVAVLDQVPSTHADHEQAADRAERTTGISCEPRRYRQHTEHDPQRAGRSRSSRITQHGCRQKRKPKQSCPHGANYMLGNMTRPSYVGGFSGGIPLGSNNASWRSKSRAARFVSSRPPFVCSGILGALLMVSKGRGTLSNGGRMLKQGVVVVFALAMGPDLAAQSDPPAQPPVALQQPSPQARVLCGTTVLPANPRVDPQIVKPKPLGNFTLQTVSPAMCRDTFATRTGELRQRLPYFFGPKR